MRHVRAQTNGFDTRTVMRAVRVQDIASQWQPDLRFLVEINDEKEMDLFGRLAASGCTNLAILTSSLTLYWSLYSPAVHSEDGLIAPGDVVAVQDGNNTAHILFRETDIHHTVFLTNRCNSNCIMCSQPPTRQDDSWLVAESIEIARHMRTSPEVIGFTGGEPLLIGANLRDIIDVFTSYHPHSSFDVLTNGRLLSDKALARILLNGPPTNVTWMVPLYGHADLLHDYVVQSYGAFEQTLDGLLTLQQHRQPIQIRIVLIKPILEELEQICRFIASNLPFVREVALMGCEPIGFALANRSLCETNIADWHQTLTDAISCLERCRIPVVLMNMPLCALPQWLWKYAHKSISDWKQSFAEECSECDMVKKCAGLFSWHNSGWRPATLRAIKQGGI